MNLSQLPRRMIRCALLCALSVLPGVEARAQSTPPVTAHFQVDRKRVFLGETFAMTLVIRSDGIQLGREINLDGMPDAATLERSDAAELPVKRQQVGNRVVETRFYRFNASPKRLGPIRIAPVLRVNILRRRGLMTFQSSYDLRVTPLTLTVLPVPDAGKPPDFSGTIGDLSFDVSLSPTELAPGDLISARIEIQGNGKFDNIKVPRFSPDGHFKVYDPEPVKDETTASRHVYTQILIPQSTNATQVGSIRFSYFDANAGRYRTITRGPFALRFKQRQKESEERYRPEQEGPARKTVTVAVKQKWETSPAARVALALALYWIVAIAVVARLLSSLRKVSRQLRLRRAAITTGLLVIFLLGSVPYRSTIDRTLGATHVAQATRQVSARLAPSVNALESFALPKGTTIQINEAWEEWIRVSDGRRGGWIPADTVELK